MYPIAKRLFDIVASGIAVVLLSPVLTFIAIVIKRGSRGPVFYKGARIGKNGRPFHILKYRTMVLDADKIGGSSTPEDDPRITGIGKFLRKYKLDELPQLFNVLKGEMSLVGPRPQVKWAVDLYSPTEKRVLSVPPGITDYASLHFSNEGEILLGSTDPDKDYMEKIHPKKMALSLKYVQERSLFLDIKIIFQTLAAILGFRVEEKV